jgi:hypothetical protein
MVQPPGLGARQLALCETEIAEMPQVFLPFATVARGETIYEKVVTKQFLLGDGRQGKGV